MKTIIVNKNFNNKYLSRNIRETFMPRWIAHDNVSLSVEKNYAINDSGILYFNNSDHTKFNQQALFDRKLNYVSEDGTYSHNNNTYWRNTVGTNGGNMQNYVKPTLFTVATQSYVDLLDKINTLLYNKQIPLTHISVDDASTRFLNLIGAHDLTERRKAFAFLLGQNLITQAEYDSTATNSMATSQYNWESFSMTYEEINDYYIMGHSTPLKLENRWLTDVNNPNSEKLYLILEIPSTWNFNNYFGDDWGRYARTNATKFYRMDNNQSIYQFSYMAYSLGDLSSDEDIQFDHIDKMDYLDSLEVAIKLPRVYN